MFVVAGQFFITTFAYDCNFAMTDLKEQCISLQFYFKLSKTATEMYKMLVQAFGNDA